jgi:uncharacterized iron-regulated membrane protein
MYVSIYFGLFAVFLPYIQVWEKPSRHFPAIDITGIDYEPMIASVTADPDFPKDNVIIDLPGFKGDPALRISHQFAKAIAFNPATLERIGDEGASSNLAMFLNGMHYGRPLQKAGLIFFGLMAVGVMFVTVGGVLLVYKLNFGNSGKTPRTLLSKWHRKVFTWVFPLFTLVVLCGSVMCLSLDGAGAMAYITTKGKYASMEPVIGPVLFPEEEPLEKADEPAAMASINELIQKAQTADPQLRFQRLTLTNWGDKTARIKIEGYNPYRPFLNGVTNRPAIVLDARDGRLIQQTRVEDRPWSVLLTESVYFLHLLFGVDILTRSLVFLVMAACGLAIGLVVMLWLHKKAEPFEGWAPFYHWMGKLSLTVMIGVIPATGVLFVLQWLLPFDLKDRLIWQQGAFFNLWLACLAWSFYRIDSYKAAKEFLTLGGALFLGAPAAHFIKSGIGPIALIQNNMASILAVDLGLAVLGTLLLLAAYMLPGSRDEAVRRLAGKKRKSTIHA